MWWIFKGRNFEEGAKIINENRKNVPGKDKIVEDEDQDDNYRNLELQDDNFEMPLVDDNDIEMTAAPDLQEQKTSTDEKWSPSKKFGRFSLKPRFMFSF